MPRNRKHPTEDQLTSAREIARSKKRGIASVMATLGFSLKSGGNPSNRTDWIIA